MASIAEAQAVTGAGSELAIMAEAVLNNAPSISIALGAVAAPTAGAAAAGSITYAGTATASGTIAVYINGRRFAVNLASGTTLAQAATATVAAHDAVAGLPTTATANGGVVTFTLKWTGTTGNGIPITVNDADNETGVPGLTTVTAGTTGGTGTPDVTGVLATISESDNLTVVAHPYVDDANLTALEALQATRWSPQLNRPIVIIGAVEGSVTQAIANPRNSFISCRVATQQSPSMPAQVAAATAGLVADQWGRDPAQQLHGRELKGIAPPVKTDQWSWANRNAALVAGISTLVIRNGKMYIDQLRNTLTTLDGGAQAGQADRYLTTVMVVGSIAYDLDQYFEANWADAKLSDDGRPQPQGQKIMTPGGYQGIIITRYRQIYERRGWVEDADGFADTLIVTRNADNANRLDASFEIRVIGNLRVLAQKIGFDFAR